jgi:mRNA interferase RelE/StbE
MYRIVYHQRVVSQDIQKLASREKKKIQRAIEQRLTGRPDLYGKPLRRSLKGYRKLRVGDYRVVFRIEEKTIKVLAILHRSVVYDVAQKRA